MLHRAVGKGISHVVGTGAAISGYQAEAVELWAGRR